MPRIMPEPRYFSIPSMDVGAEVRMKRALNCWPWVWSLIHSPDAVTHSPAEIVAACPTTVMRSRCPRALIRRTQKPLSLLWKVTRSTRPARTSWADTSGFGFMSVVLSSVSVLGTLIPWQIEFDRDMPGRLRRAAFASAMQSIEYRQYEPAQRFAAIQGVQVLI